MPTTETESPVLLNKGNGDKFASDEWAADINNSNHVWFVKANGQIGSDWKPIAFNYTVSADQAGKTLNVHGHYSAAGSGQFSILLSKDTNSDAVEGPYETLFEYEGSGTDFDLKVTAEEGNDIVFVSREHQYWWEPSTLNATIDEVQEEQVAQVAADVPSGEIAKNASVSLSSTTQGATIYYTNDNTDPLTSATKLQYASPIQITEDTVIKAVAVKDGWLPSDPITLTYTLIVDENPPTGVNPSTNNVTDFNSGPNVVKPGKWSYLQMPTTETGSPGLLSKGNGDKFASDEWAADINNSNHVWFVKSNGQIGTDWKPIAFNYTVSDDQLGKPLRLQGKYSANPSGHFRILLSKDTNPNAVSGPYETLFEYTGNNTTFRLETVVASGNDIVFVSDNHQYWWEPSKLDATIVTENVPQVQGVTSDPGAGSIPAGVQTPISLSSSTEGATIYYTTDNTDPLNSETKKEYTDAIRINQDTVIKAVAVKDGMEPSDISAHKFIVKEQFRNFNGINQGPDADLIGNMAWNRFDFSWGGIEPAKGQINQNELNELKRRVLEAKNNGITIIPVLAYTAGWAANRSGYTYEYNGYTYEVGPVLSEQNNNFRRQVVQKNAKGAVVSTTTRDFEISKTPPENVEDWKKFVQLIVTTFGAAPYNLEYFQVWNEAHPESGFWWGGLDQYMDLIHLPAAQVIHDAGKKVVYGGWICGAPIYDYISLLDRKDAWQTVDVFDMHYMPLEAIDQLYRAAVQRGIANPAVWQTELGFSLNDKFVADTYPRAFYWALDHQSSNPDQFKLFYFANWAPNDPAAYGYNRSLHSGDGLSPKGKTLDILSKLFRGTEVTTYSNFTTAPYLKPELNENLSSAEGFMLDGKRVVVAVHLKNQGDANIFTDWNGTGDTIHLGLDTSTISAEFSGIDENWTVKRVDLFGNEKPLAWNDASSAGSMQVIVPIKDTDPEVGAINATGNETIFYIVAENPNSTAPMDTVKPSWPANSHVTSSNVKQTELTLTWTPAEDNVGVANYEISWGTGHMKSVTSAELTTTITGLTAATEFTFTVKAVDAAGNRSNSGPSAIVRTLEATSGNEGNETPGNNNPTPNTSTGAPTTEGVTDPKVDQDGNFTVEIANGAHTASIPANLTVNDDRKIKVGNATGTLEVPGSVMKKLQGLLTANELKDATITFSMVPIPASDRSSLLAHASESSNAAVTAAGEIYDFSLSIRSKDGQERSLTQFDEPITLTLQVDPTASTDLLGIYYIANDGSLTYVGGKRVDGNLVAQVTHFSKYAILSYDKSFVDVGATYWASHVIKQMAAKHIIQGISDTEFAPGRNITRAEFTALIVRALNLKAKGAAPFSDVNASDWFASDIAAANEAGIVNGVGEFLFNPNASITREEMAVMLIHAYDYGKGVVSSNEAVHTFADRDRISPWAQAAVSAAQSLGFINGRGDNQFAPKGLATRAETAQVIAKLLGL
ncbi:S-layer homology domain-containing protein [Cohnella sp. GCM10020058]